MYDAKKNQKDKVEENKLSSIYDRGYFNKTQGGSILSTKTAYVPSETIFFK